MKIIKIYTQDFLRKTQIPKDKKHVVGAFSLLATTKELHLYKGSKKTVKSFKNTDVYVNDKLRVQEGFIL